MNNEKRRVITCIGGVRGRMRFYSREFRIKVSGVSLAYSFRGDSETICCAQHFYVRKKFNSSNIHFIALTNASAVHTQINNIFSLKY